MFSVGRWQFDVLVSPATIFNLPTSIFILFLTLLLLSSAANAAELRGVRDGIYLNLSWEASEGELQEAATPNGPWQTVTMAVCPYRTATASARKF